MKRLQGFKFELMPNGAQQRDIRRFAGSCRFVFNKARACNRPTALAVVATLRRNQPL
jgi:putative transposase